MKTSTRKNLFLIGGIVLLVHLFVSILTYILLVSSPDIIASIASLYNISYDELTQIYAVFVVVFTIVEVITAVMTLIASIVFFKKSKYNEEEFESKKNSNLVWSVVILLLIDFIPGILGVIASVVTSNETKSQDADQTILKETSISNAIDQPNELQTKIAKLKKLKEIGDITEEEYEKLFSSLIK